MVVCKPEEARIFSCCVMQKYCEGNACMAWTKHLIPAENQPEYKFSKSGFPTTPPKTVMVDSGKEYCGRCK